MKVSLLLNKLDSRTYTRVRLSDAMEICGLEGKNEERTYRLEHKLLQSFAGVEEWLPEEMAFSD